MEITKLYPLYKENPIVSTDSRKIEPGCMFFALKGENFDGNIYAESAVKKGARHAIIDDERYDKGENYIVVEDVLTTLQKLASHHVEQLKPGLKVLGLTGSNGKTTTKELIANVLKTQYRVQYTEGNLNNHIGVPLTLLKIEPDTEIAIIEMGANNPGEIALLASIAKPDLGLITNIGEAHLEGFGSIEGVLKAKSELFDYINNENKIFLVNSNDPLLSRKFAKKPNSHLVYYGNNKKSIVHGVILESAIDMQKVQLVLDGNKYQFKTMLIGSYNLDNFLAAAAVGLFFKIPENLIIKSLSDYEPKLQRSQSIKTEKNQIILDAYNANPTSMLAALKNFSALDAKNKMVILGGMKEVGKDSVTSHQEVIDFLNTNNLHNAILIGYEFKYLKANPYNSFSDVNELLEWLKLNKIEGNTILVKGSRANQLEKIIGFL